MQRRETAPGTERAADRRDPIDEVVVPDIGLEQEAVHDVRLEGDDARHRGVARREEREPADVRADVEEQPRRRPGGERPLDPGGHLALPRLVPDDAAADEVVLVEREAEARLAMARGHVSGEGPRALREVGERAAEVAACRHR